MELIDMSWDERWARVRFRQDVAGAGGVDALRQKLMRAGAWCTPSPGGGNPG